MTEKHELIVRTLGDFTITWQGHQISGGSRDSQFARLMGILLHYSETGVERGRLEDMLFEDSSSMDPHHMLRTVIYNAKKKLEKAGLNVTLRTRRGRKIGGACGQLGKTN